METSRHAHVHRHTLLPKCLLKILITKCIKLGIHCQDTVRDEPSSTTDYNLGSVTNCTRLYSLGFTRDS